MGLTRESVLMPALVTPLLGMDPSPIQRAKQKPLPLYCHPLGQDVPLLPPARKTGSAALWLCRSHYRGIGSQKGRRSHCFPLLETSGSTEQEKTRARGLLRRPGQHRGALACLATSQKANPPKPTATQSISGDEATENDPQGAEREGFEPSTEVASCNSLAGSRFQPLSHLSSGAPRVPSAGQVVRLQRGADVV